ncbi:NACHT domain-containing protein [Nonomuraea rhodomycinica]|uniref:NACHT domain-containing protein n=1 Tax=Nonomuraea rhodomycinica TaxID=1712872 RepID=A0A7Y6MD36_9ACTN|nr:NACHT domain-containing protein [Nonomuraea rhodomycinica]NUW42530.1 NACHT domain-containing protein [Nonomuraea rhodomycinica]
MAAGLHKYLQDLESKAQRQVPGYRREQVIEQVNRGRPASLSTSTVGDWMAKGRTPRDFPTLWAFVEALHRAITVGQDPPPAWWKQERSKCEGLWEAALELRRAAGGLAPAVNEEQHARSVRHYLRAVEQAAASHPYPGVLPGSPLPPLRQVHVRRRVTTPARPGTGDQERCRPAEEVLATEGRVVLLLGGPGAGKSSFLRTSLIALAEQWTSGAGTGSVPVYVPAHFLTREGVLGEQLAQAVRSQIKGRDCLPPPASFFAGPPLPGGRWLILVDGLDEIPDAAERIDVLRRLASLPGDRYELLVASRPLPEEQLSELGPADHVERFELVPFDPRQLPDFARSWMTAAGVGDPERAVATLLAQAVRPPLDRLATNPLLATIMCQLHAHNVDSPLPASRYGIYQHYADLLVDHLDGRLHNRMDSPLVERLAGHPGLLLQLRGRLLGALDELALLHMRQDVPAALESLIERVADLRPHTLRGEDWHSVVTDLLHATGLVTVRGTRIDFLHQTIAEFLAARYVAADADLSKSAFRQLFGSRWLRPLRLRKGGGESSYGRMLVAAWLASPRRPRALLDVLRRLAARDGTVGRVAELAGDGASLPQEIRDLARRRCHRTATTTLSPAEMTLIESLGGGPSIELQKQLTSRRIRAARMLVNLGDERGRSLLDMITLDTTLPAVVRFDVARTLGRQEGERAGDLLETLARDTEVTGDHRVLAARQLALMAPSTGPLPNRRGVDLLELLAGDITLHILNRVAAAAALHRYDGERGRDLHDAAIRDLDLFARDTGADGRARVASAVWLADVRHPGAVNLLASLVRDRTLRRTHRRRAERRLAELGVLQAEGTQARRCRRVRSQSESGSRW